MFIFKQSIDVAYDNYFYFLIHIVSFKLFVMTEYSGIVSPRTIQKENHPYS